ncbi:putative transporter subunit: membrane component of ABC superfamily [Alteromonas sp. 38]|uniref:ABC transporter permease n=1 Tax=Alteromonas TaxID=226 RepID=UPI0012F27A35|nr:MULTISPECIES: ABC transporter permease [Alteromonas]CAD5256016.1 putative transporter subunit: membrane component of ABC superfamily [Alteromonas sp. 154]VXA95435.1 putative transporter subunit: membrane component of ABC superfamily [Alteromonas sp. 38]
MKLKNVLHLSVKELWSLWRDPVMLVLIFYVFTLNIYTAATAVPESLHNAPIAFVDHDRSQLSHRVIDGFVPPYFLTPEIITEQEVNPSLDTGKYTFVVTIPPSFEKDVMKGLVPDVQVNVDATRISQAFTGNGYITEIIGEEVSAFVAGYKYETRYPVGLVMRARFNPALESFWFGSVMELINAVTMIAIILSGAALIREKERGTVEHLLAMPVSSSEIMLSKIAATLLVVWLATLMSVYLVIQYVLGIPINGDVWLFMLAVAIHLFAVSSLGIFMATIARSMPQFGLLLILVLLPLQLLSGGVTPRESMPEMIQYIMLLAPNTHFVMASQGVLYRGAGLSVVYPQLIALTLIGGVLYYIALRRFKSTVGSMA